MRTESVKTFKQAAKSYIKNGGEIKYLRKIVRYLKNKALQDIYPFDILKMADKLYPNHKGSTKNRQVVTPVRSVFRHAYDRGWCSLISIRSFKVDKPKRLKAATPIWLHAFTKQCDKDNLPHLAAIVLFMSTTGTRISDSIALRWKDVDFKARTVLLLKTKTDTNATCYLTEELLDRLRRLKRNRINKRVFQYTCRHSVNERIKAVCKRASIPDKPPHTCGRKTFATRALELGVDIPTAMQVGGGKSSKVFLEIYVQTRADAGRRVADKFAFDRLDYN